MRAFFNNVNLLLEKISSKLEIKNKWLRLAVSTGVFLLALHLLFTYVGVYKFINNRPCSIHSSAQCQRASVALNYYENDMNFFEPRIQRYVTGTGVTGLEFPIIYYAAAVMYKMFGAHEIYLRVIDLLIMVFGLFLFYRLSLKYIKSSVLVIFIVGSAVLSPVLLFYMPNFLPDAPSVGFVLASWYFFFKYLDSSRIRHAYLFVVFGTLAALIKSVAILCFLVVFCLMILDLLRFFKKTHRETLIPDKKRLLTIIIVGIIVFLAWYGYAHYITIKNKNHTFGLGPMMVDSWAALGKVLEFVKNYWMYHYFAYESYVLLISALALMLLGAKFVDRLLGSITILYILGSMGYIYFFTYQFQNHDYYIIAILPAVFFTLLTFGDLMVKISVRYSRLIIVSLVIVLFFNMKEALLKCKTNYYNRYLYEVTYLSGGDYRPYEDLEPELRKIGIKRTDKTLSIFDNTFCSSLYLMNQLGVNLGDDATPLSIDSLVRKYNFKYAVVNDSARFQRLYQGQVSNKIVLTYRGLIVYKLN